VDQSDVKKATSIRDKWNVGETFNMHVIGVLESEEGERMVRKPDFKK